VRARTRRLRGLLFVILGVALTGAVVAAYALDGLEGAERNTVDTRFSIRGDEKPPGDLVVVQIDDVTFDELGVQWPFPRELHGQVVDRVIADDPKVILYDVQFSEQSNLGEEDDIKLAEAILNSEGRVVFSFTETDPRGGVNFIGGGQAQLDDVEGRAGNGLFPNDPGGVIRRMAFEIDKLRSLGIVTYETGSGKRVDRADFPDEDAWIDYRGGPGTMRTVSFSQVADNKLPRGFFKDKYVVIGPSAPSLQDVHPTSTTGSNEEMSGAEIQANALDTVRRGFPLRSTSDPLNYLLIVVLGMVAPLASMRLSPSRSLTIAVGVGVAYAVAAQLLFNGGDVLPVVYPLVALGLTSVGALAIHYVTAAFERERVRDMFSRFVPENVVDDVLANADEGLRLGGVQREGTVMFTDLRGFTSFAEEMQPDEVIEVLNRYLSEMSDAILNHGGTLVAYMGDGIMAVFGAPIGQDDHADRALATAREMLDERLPRFNRSLEESHLGEGFRMGIGLNSGQVMSGNVGSERRLEYTAIGDVTNTASRIEGMTKGTEHQLFVAQSTREMLQNPPDDLFEVGEFEVRGREQKVRLWSLPEAAADGPSPPGAAAESQPAA
jgi:adenylate cyclase